MQNQKKTTDDKTISSFEKIKRRIFAVIEQLTKSKQIVSSNEGINPYKKIEIKSAID
jgi:hypothetical protein